MQLVPVYTRLRPLHRQRKHEDSNSGTVTKRRRLLGRRNNPDNTPRENTVAALWEQLQQVRVIHVRGTPTSGKSTLADLLEAYVKRKRPDFDVHLFDWPDDIKGFEQNSYYHLLNNILDQQPTYEFRHLVEERKYVGYY